MYYYGEPGVLYWSRGWLALQSTPCARKLARKYAHKVAEALIQRRERLLSGRDRAASPSATPAGKAKPYLGVVKIWPSRCGEKDDEKTSVHPAAADASSPSAETHAGADLQDTAEYAWASPHRALHSSPPADDITASFTLTLCIGVVCACVCAYLVTVYTSLRPYTHTRVRILCIYRSARSSVCKAISKRKETAVIADSKT